MIKGVKKHITHTAAILLSASALSAQEKPNIIVFLVDDMGLMDTSVPFAVDKKKRPERHPLNEWYQTPNMEKLASQGVRFSTFYAQSVSSPTRTSLLTGQNAARHRTTNWIDPNSNNRTPYGPADWNWEGLTASDQTYPTLLKEAGYRTIHVGKAHFGRAGSEGEDPTRLGFDVNIAGAAIGHPGSYRGEEGYGYLGGQRSHAVPNLEEYHGTETFLTDALTIEAGKAIEKAVNEQLPFFLNLSHYAVHTPFQLDERFIENYPEGEKSPQARAYATLIEGMDKSLGDLMQKLEALGVAENTLIFFLGDNGGDAPLGEAGEHGSSAPFRGKKGSEYEGGSRAPFIVSWAKPNPNNSFQKKYPVAQNFVQTQISTVMDLYPSILAVSEVETPLNYQLDGSDLGKLLQGKKDRQHRDDFLLHFPHQHRGSYFTTYRKGDWKVIYYYNPDTDGIPTYKLYNLKKDPYEEQDLSLMKPKKLKKLCKQMIQRLGEENALYVADKNEQSIYPVVPD